MNLRETPLVTVLPPDLDAAIAANQERFTEVLANVEAAPSVTAAREAFEAATRDCQRFAAARAGLNLRGKELTERVATADARLEDCLLASFSEGQPQSDVSELLDGLLRERTEYQAVSRVVEKLAEHLIPCADIARLRAEMKLFYTRADEVSAVAHARFERTAELMRTAIDHESGIAIDIKSTFSGALLLYADELNGKAAQCRQSVEVAEQRRKELTEKTAPFQGRR